MTNEAIKETVNQLFTDYLEKKQYRKTNERYAILDEIYSTSGHFDVDTLYDTLNNKNKHISRATLYNTIELLLECNLVVKHQFGKNIAHYERAHHNKQHDHLICIKCGRVIEFCDPRIYEIQTSAAAIMKFKIEYHSLYFYGLCDKCK